jgi:hypothetical protein
MNLKEELLRGIYAYGFEKPSAIQQRAIVPCIKVGKVFFILFKGIKAFCYYALSTGAVTLIFLFIVSRTLLFCQDTTTGGKKICIFDSCELLIQIGVVKCNNLCSSSDSD